MARAVLRALCALLLLPAAAAAQAPSLRVSAPRVMLPLVTAETLDAGRVASDPVRGVYALEIEVSTQDPGRGWIVYLRAEEPSFRPEAAGIPCTELRWKLDEESERAWRPLDGNESILLEKPGGGDARIALDISVDLGWNTDPGAYSLGIAFRAAGL